jgi:hypothetical protein
MISDAIVKQNFISRTLTDEAQWIATRQQKVIESWGLIRSGLLYNSLRGFFSFHPSGSGGGVLTLRYLAYMRLLDINARKKGKNKYSGLHLYNRIVFGRIYNDTIRKLKFGFTEPIRENIMAGLQQAADALNHK